MKAVIMAGGEGSRLRPLTCDTPKPMVRLCGKPAICYILELLARHGVTQAAVTVRYLAEQITSYFDSGEYSGIKLDFVKEERPLGTAGGVKNAVGGSEGDFIVISGDALCDIDLAAAVMQHRQTGADATIVVTHVSDPREYGLVSFDCDGVVTGFVEKPGWTQASTDAANTGIYILNADVMELVPEGREYDFAKDLFVQMLAAGRKICVYETDGYWCDIGGLGTYLSCQHDLLAGRAGGILPETDRADMAAGGVFLRDDMPQGDFKTVPPVYIGRGVKIGTGAVIGPNAIICDGASVGAFARVRSSCLLSDAYVGDRARLTGAVVCASASVKAGAEMFEGSAAGAGSVIGSDAKILQDVRIWPAKYVDDGARVCENLRFGSAARELFDDGGICGEAGVELTPEFCARLGAAAASLKCGSRIGVANSPGRAARTLKSAFIAGALSTGAQVWNFGEITEAEAAFSVSFCGLELAAYISGGAVCSVKLLGDGGLPAVRPTERELEGRLMRGEFTRCSWNAYREVADMTGMRLLYQQELYRCAAGGLAGMAARPRSDGREGARLLEDALLKLGCDTGSGPVMTLSEDGMHLSIRDTQAGAIPPERVLAVCCLIELEDGYDIALPCDAPLAIDRLAERYGKTVKRYMSCPADFSEREIRRFARSRYWLRDGMMSAVKILDYMKRTNQTLHEINGRIPAFCTAARTVGIDENPSRLLAGFSSDENHPHEGVLLMREGGSLTIRPSKKGSMLKITAEAADAETAEELCNEITGSICPHDRTGE